MRRSAPWRRRERLALARDQGGGGKDVKQVQEWLGHAGPGFTLRTYVHLINEGLGDADFLDATIQLAPITAD